MPPLSAPDPLDPPLELPEPPEEPPSGPPLLPPSGVDDVHGVDEPDVLEHATTRPRASSHVPCFAMTLTRAPRSCPVKELPCARKISRDEYV
jgi:hypothetical protein